MIKLWRTFIQSFALAICAFFVSFGAAQASDANDMVAAMGGICVTSLDSKVAVGPGLTRADPAMEAKLLNGKTGTIWRTWNSKVVIVAHASGSTCEVMGIGIDPVDYEDALNAWLGDHGDAFRISEEASFSADTPGGAYLATQLDDGEFIQMFVQSHPDSRFIGVTIARVSDSTDARELLGL